MTTPRLPPADLEAAACGYDDANAYQGIPARDAAYKGFLAGAEWAGDRPADGWVPWATNERPPKPGTYEVTKGDPRRPGLRVCSAAYWDGGRFLNAANVLAWRPLPPPWAPGEGE